MSTGRDHAQALSEQIAEASRQRAPLAIRAGNTKAFLGESVAGGELDVRVHSGIVTYEPGELILTARAGTPLAEVESTLAGSGQMLAFEPPHFGHGATLGGTIATGVSGPRRPFAGAARDFVLGVRVINGCGEILSFGGQVMKNVAGYDLSRLMAGAQGTLGVLLEVSLKVLPRPRAQRTLVFDHERSEALDFFSGLGGQPLPLTAGYWEAGRTFLRLAGAEAAVAAATRSLGGESLEDGAGFWISVREQKRDFFAGDGALWRLSLPPAAPVLDLAGPVAIDWAGAQRWLRSDEDAEKIRSAAAAHGGHASIRSDTADCSVPRLHPLSRPLQALHRRIKQSFDPEHVLNRGRLYPGF